MAIIVEDGTGVPGANSFASLEDLSAYADERGIALPAGEDERRQLLVRAMDYIETRWPSLRLGVLTWPYQYINVLSRAQCDIAANSVGLSVFPVRQPSDKGAITQVTAGPVSVSYASPAEPDSTARFPYADALLRQLAGGWRLLRTRRV